MIGCGLVDTIGFYLVCANAREIGNSPLTCVSRGLVGNYLFVCAYVCCLV